MDLPTNKLTDKDSLDKVYNYILCDEDTSRQKKTKKRHKKRKKNKNEEEDKENEEILKKIREYKIKTKELQKEVEMIMKLNKNSKKFLRR